MSASQWHTRVLAVDFGTKRLGLAVSDALGITAQGLPTRERTRLDDVEAVDHLASRRSDRSGAHRRGSGGAKYLVGE